MKNVLFSITLLLSTIQLTYAQTAGQTKNVKGVVIDADSKKPLKNVEVTIVELDLKTNTGEDGVFIFNSVPVGAISIKAQIAGYESKTIPEIYVTSGKEVEISIALNEQIVSVNKDVVVVSKKNRSRALNEFATVSARSFNMDDAKRYPAAIADPARMAQNFAGVSASDDGSNEIVVRGNSPQSVLWRLEGIEIPNPNHFAGIGAAGGAVSMFSSTVLGKSDFYTGAFPAEFGNATSGVFDLNYRNGNKDKKEYAFNIGVLGLGAAAEGPFKKGGKSSYLINFRYSTFGLITQLINTEGQQLNYQDLNFKFNFPTKAGTFGLFGLVGNNSSERTAKKGQTSTDFDVFEFKTTLNVVGLSHQIFVGKNAYLKTVFANTGIKDKGVFGRLIPTENYINRPFFNENSEDKANRISSFYNVKLNKKGTLRVGGIFSNLSLTFKNKQFGYFPIVSIDVPLDIKAQTNMMQGYAQFKYRITEKITLNTGVHTTYLALNKTSSIDPRASISYNTSNGETLTFATGIHSKPQQLSVYFFENVVLGGARKLVNKNLKMNKALHFVLGYEKSFQNGVKLKVESYYQSLSNIPVEAKIGSGFSLINSSVTLDLLETEKLVSKGKGTNYGIDINIEKNFNKKFYYIANLSLYNSKYKTFDNRAFDSRFNRNYQLNLVGGREWTIGRKKKTFGINGKILTTGGTRQSEIDFTASRLAGQTILFPNKFFTQVNKAYFRPDLGISIKSNRKKATHVLSLDIQNVANRKNQRGVFFDPNGGVDNLGGKSTGSANEQLGIVPILNYRIEF